jgi:hypothetical protein
MDREGGFAERLRLGAKPAQSVSRAMSVFSVKLHALSGSDSFDVHSRRPAHVVADVEDLEAELQFSREEIA